MQKFPLRYPKSEHEKRIGEYFRSPWRWGCVRHAAASDSYQNFVICFVNRSGSNLLARALHSSGRFGLAGEFLNHPRVLKVSREHGIRTLADYLRHTQAHHSSQNGVFGTKLGWAQLYYLTRLGLIPEVLENPRFVMIERDDLLGQAISYAIAHQTKAWTSKHQPVSTSYRYDGEDILRRIHSISAAYARFRDYFAVFGIKPVTVSYEELEAELVGTVQRVIEQLAIPETGCSRVRPGRIAIKRQRGVLNEEIRARFQEAYGFSSRPLAAADGR